MLNSKKYLCSILEAAQLLGVGRTKIYDLLWNGEIESVKIGSRRLIKVDSINELVERNSEELV
jgi:excisionase family DNA binding protein